MTCPAVCAAVVLPVPAGRAWATVTDVAAHARWIPLTRIDAPRPAPLALGDVFTAVSGPGATRGGPGLPDRMVLAELTDPVPARGRTPARTGRAVYRKLGPVLLGTAEVAVRPLGAGHCQVTWTERVHLRGPHLPGWPLATAVALRPVLGPMLRLALRRIRAELTPR